MTFAIELRDSLQERTGLAPIEFAVGKTLEDVLNRHLIAVESSADTILLTSILLLDDEKKRLRHVAAPTLPADYCEAIDGSQIGPAAGSCGTAAFFGHAIYVTDIATDPLWSDYRDIALPFGLRACWSTPIRDERGEVMGTFAIYHPTPRSPTREEVSAISMITDHVAECIEWSRSMQAVRIPAGPGASPPFLRPVLGIGGDRRSNVEPATVDLLHAIAVNFETLADNIEREIRRQARDGRSDEYLASLIRVRDSARKGAGIVRMSDRLQ